jgi:branched-chain amino acid transport system substrate-binding protein
MVMIAARPAASCVAAWLLGAIFVSAAFAAGKHYDAGASDTEVLIGNIAPYTGPASDYGAVARAEAAYFRMINDRGGVHGRKIKFITLDDGSDPNRAPALAQRLVEQEQVLALFSTFGTDANVAIRAYANEHKVPQLFVETSSAIFDDAAHFPWTMGFYATFRSEGLAYASYLLQTRPNARIAVLYEDSTNGAEYYQGFRDGLGAKAAMMIVGTATYASTESSLATQIQTLKDSGADVFLDFAAGTAATTAIREAYDLGWRPLQFIPNASLSTAAFLEPAGLDKAAGIITNARSKGWLNPTARRDPQVRDFVDWMAQYNPDASLRDQLNVAGYERAEALVAVLQNCGDDLTRANVMSQAAHLDTELGMLRPGIRLKTSASDYQPIKQLFLIRFNGREWLPMDHVVGGASGT